MSDWRGESNEPAGSPGKRKAFAAPPQQPPLSDTREQDWRGRAAPTRRPVAASAEREWLSHADTSAGASGGSSAVRKLVALLLLSTAILTTIGGFLFLIFARTPPIPVLISIGQQQQDVGDIANTPFSDRIKDSFLEIPEQNVRIVLPSTDDTDLLLREVASNDRWTTNLKKDVEANPLGRIRLDGDSRIVGGGPGHRLAVYYFSGIVARAAQADAKTTAQWQLLTDRADPFATEQSGDGVNAERVDLQTAMRRVAEQTADGAVALMVMDVRPPASVANLGDLGFPADAFRRAFESLEARLQDRLIVALPCGEGQENWIAPELSCTPFCYHLQSGLVEGFGRRDLSLQQFLEFWSREVEQWAAEQRYSLQRPELLMGTAVRGELENIDLFGRTSRLAEMPPPVGVSDAALETNFAMLDDMWERFSTLQRTLYTRPLLYGRVESGLILLEELAEYAAGDSGVWTARKDAVEQDLNELAAGLPPANREVSLIEKEIHAQVYPASGFAATLVEDANAKSRSDPMRFYRDVTGIDAVSGTVGNASDPTSASPPAADPDERGYLFYRAIHSVSAGGNQVNWDEIFSPAATRRWATYLEPAGQPDSLQWLELRLLAIIGDVLQTTVPSEAASEAAARLVVAFDRLQRAACHWRVELAAWNESAIAVCDRQFLMAVDQFVAGQFPECSLQLTRNFEPTISQLEERVDRLERSMAARDQALHRIPQLLAVLMRLGRYPDNNPDEDLAIAANLALVRRDAGALVDALRTPREEISVDAKPVEEGLAAVTRQLEGRYSTLVDRQNTQAATDPETIRDYRATLRYPGLAMDLRRARHRWLVAAYTTQEPSRGAVPTGEEDSRLAEAFRRPESIAKAYADELRSLRVDAPVSTAIALDDPRWSQWPTDSESREGHSGRDEGRETAYDATMRVLELASSHGQRAASHPDSVAEDRWPWIAPLRLAAIDDADYRTGQATRLYAARWGDSPFDQDEENYYFRRLAQQYEQPPPHLRNLGVDNEGRDELERLWHAAVSAVQATPPEAAQTPPDSPLVTLQWNDAVKSQWEFGWATVLYNEPNRNPNAPVERRVAVPLSGGDPPKSVETALPPAGQETSRSITVTHRGHRKAITVPLMSQDNLYVVRQTPTEPRPSKLRVDAKIQDQNIIVMLDCSMSMLYGRSHDKAENAVRQLLEKLEDLAARGIKSHVALVVFGVNVTKDRQPPRQLRPASAAGLQFDDVCVSDFYTVDEFFELEGLLSDDFIKPTGYTPLYAAMHVATDLIASQPSREGKIVIVSDGSNETDERASSASGQLTRSKLQQRLAAVKPEVYVYQYNNLGFYEQASYPPGHANYQDGGDNHIWKGLSLTTKKNAIKQSNQELFALLQEVNPDSKRQGTFESFEQIDQRIMESFALPMIEVRATNSDDFGRGEVGQEIDLPFSGPASIRVVDTGYDSAFAAKGQGSAIPLEIEIRENEYFQMVYDSDSGKIECRSPDTIGEGPTGRPLAWDWAGEQWKDISAFLNFKLKSDRSPVFELELLPTRSGPTPWFLRKPVLLLTRVAAADDLSKRMLYLADYRYQSGRHYPLAELPPLPWSSKHDPSGRTYVAAEVDLDIWVSYDIPADWKRIDLPSGDGSQSDGRWRIARQGDKVTVQAAADEAEGSVPPTFVICPEAAAATRTFHEPPDGPNPTLQVHEFTVPADLPCRVLLVNPSQLERVISLRDPAFAHTKKRLSLTN